jgi:DNA-directed RNA polymerase alpha subunit
MVAETDPLNDWAVSGTETYYCPLCYKGAPWPLVRFTWRENFVKHLREHQLADWLNAALVRQGGAKSIPAERTLRNIKILGDMNISRVVNALERRGYETIESVDAASDRDLLRIRNIGKKGLALARQRIDQYLERNA